MRTVELSKDIVFDVIFYDSSDQEYDPDEVEFAIVTNGTRTAFGPWFYTDGKVTRSSTGRYHYTFSAPEWLTPGYFTGKWTTEIEGDDHFEYENFQVVDHPVVPGEMLDAPRRYGIIRESYLYTDFGYGSTDRLFLIGHAAGLNINDPYQVVNMQEAINLIGAEFDAPLFLALMEAYNSGARDIWLVAAAPLTEYIPPTEDRFAPHPEWGGLNFYERYHERLDTTYTLLESIDLPELLVPLEAPFYDAGDVDFLTQLVDHCEAAFEKTGAPRMGMIGTRMDLSAEAVEVMVSDPRLTDLGPGGKFVMVVIGEGTNILPQGLTGYRCSGVVSAAAALANKRVDQGLTYQYLPYMSSLAGRNLTQDEINSLCRARLNPIIRSQRGKRGAPFQCLVATDNTLSQEGSDFWSISTMRLVTKVMQDIRALGKSAIGTVAFPKFQFDVKRYFTVMVQQDLIKNYELNIERDPVDPTKIYVDVKLDAHLCLREVYFTVEVGTTGV